MEHAAEVQNRPGKSLEFTMRQYPCAKMKLDQFFFEWLSLPEYERLIATILDNAANNRPLKVGVEAATRGEARSNASSPPMSPKHATRDERGSGEFSAFASSGKPTGEGMSSSGSAKAPEQSIPQFYFPEGGPKVKEVRVMKAELIRELFLPFQTDGMPQLEFVKVVQDVCELPRMVAYPLFNRLTDGGTYITQEVFQQWWESERLALAPISGRLIAALRSDPSEQCLTKDDLLPLLRAIVHYHPSLEFLSDHPEFQDRYTETVSYRIFYTVNKSRNGKISQRELKRSDFIDALFELDAEQDINRVLRYFSYEHFYVIYCKFWELDKDHDFYLDRNDLIRYGCHCLTYKIVDRIFDTVVLTKNGMEEEKMDYEEFVWFILSKEDKTTEASIDLLVQLCRFGQRRLSVIPRHASVL